MDRPLARLNNGKPEMDRGGVYEPITRIGLLAMLLTMDSLPGEHARQKAQEVRQVLEAVQ